MPKSKRFHAGIVKPPNALSETAPSDTSAPELQAALDAATANESEPASTELPVRLKDAIDLIKTIAEQTHLLALQATSEAGASTSGHGFAIVAQEVKQLAKATAKSVTKIGRIIELAGQKGEPENSKVANSGARDLLSELKNSFESEPRIKAEFVKASLESINTVLDKLSEATGLHFQEKLRCLDDLHSIISGYEERIVPIIPTVPPRLWNDWKHEYDNPYRFAHDTYGEAAQIMIMSDFKIDMPLYNAMYKYRLRKGEPPADLDIARHFEVGRKIDIPEQLITWADVMADAPEHTREKIRAYRAQRTRMSRRNTNS